MTIPRVYRPKDRPLPTPTRATLDQWDDVYAELTKDLNPATPKVEDWDLFMKIADHIASRYVARRTKDRGVHYIDLRTGEALAQNAVRPKAGLASMSKMFPWFYIGSHTSRMTGRTDLHRYGVVPQASAHPRRITVVDIAELPDGRVLVPAGEDGEWVLNWRALT